MSDFLDYNKSLLTDRSLIENSKISRLQGTSETLEQNTQIFLRNLIPYTIGQQINNISGIAEQFSGGDILGGTLNSISTIANLSSTFKTLTPTELAKYLSLNFYLAPIADMREYAIKKSVFSIRSGIAKEFNLSDHFEEGKNLNGIFWSLNNAKKRDLNRDSHFSIIKNYTTETLRGIKEIRKDNMPDKLGFMYVTPIGSGGELASFKVPFQFLPAIQESPVQAKYKKQEIISRIGPIMQYVGTDSLSLNINLKYHILNDRNFDDRGNFGAESWMQYYTEENVDAIETALRSLVLPNYTSDSDRGTGYKFTGTKLLPPPYVKIILGTGSMDVVEDSETTPYQALTTTYLSNLESPVMVRRMFVVESVNIRKDLERTPLYIRTTSSGKKYYNTHGFEASLSLFEITPNYLSLMPDYYVTISKAQSKVTAEDMLGLGVFDTKEEAQRFSNTSSIKNRQNKVKGYQDSAAQADLNIRVQESITAFNDLTNLSIERTQEILDSAETQNTIQNSLQI